MHNGRHTLAHICSNIPTPTRKILRLLKKIEMLWEKTYNVIIFTRNIKWLCRLSQRVTRADRDNSVARIRPNHYVSSCVLFQTCSQVTEYIYISTTGCACVSCVSLSTWVYKIGLFKGAWGLWRINGGRPGRVIRTADKSWSSRRWAE